MHSITIGMDLGDKNSVVCVMNGKGIIVDSHTVDNTAESIRTFYANFKGATVALEAGTHSPCISRLLTTMGCTVLVGNPRKLRVIWDSNDKCIELMAELTNECEWKRDVTGICEKNGSPRRTYLDKAFSWKRRLR